MLGIMDLLEQYKTEHPEAFARQPADMPVSDVPAIVRMVMRLSGGKVVSIKAAYTALLISASVLFIAALLVFFVSSGSSSIGKARFSTECFPVACK